jgi:DNA-binding response OmpR family regulator
MQLMTVSETQSVVKLARQPKIMVVDDDANLRQALQLRLRANHYEVMVACDGYSALALAQKELPDLILLDLGLPAGDGFKVLQHLREFPRLCLIPVIVLSARDPEANEKRTLEAGAMCFFQKPADNEELLGMIRLCLAAGSAPGGELPS